jgi:hypothetical protein
MHNDLESVTCIRIEWIKNMLNTNIMFFGTNLLNI